MIEKTREELAVDVNRIVKEFFQNVGYGTVVPVISYSEYMRNRYKFQYVNDNCDTKMWLRSEKKLDLFKSRIRSYLKSNGYPKVSFIIQKITVRDTLYDVNCTRLQLDAIRFDRN